MTARKVNKPVDKTEWGMTPQTINAYYNPTTNEICFPAAILQPPFQSALTNHLLKWRTIMTTINLKRYYPYMTENVMLEVSDEIAATLSMGGRLCDSYKRQKRRNGECSLDTDPGFEVNVLRQPLTPDEYIEARETTFALYDALAQLPPTQARRVYQHYLLGMSKAEIAAAEGVGRSRICCSIERGLAAMKNILKKSL